MVNKSNSVFKWIFFKINNSFCLFVGLKRVTAFLLLKIDYIAIQ